MEKKILFTFLYNHKLKFNEIEKLTKIRSNKLCYHIQKLIKKGLLIKEKDFYKLSDATESLIPYLTDKKAILPVILIIIKRNKKEIFLYSRIKRPYKNKLSLPGGRILVGETIPNATERIMKKKFYIECNFKKINSVSLEQIKKKNKTIHSFLLILVTAETKKELAYTNIEKNKKKVILSDYNLIKKDLNKKVSIKGIFSRI
ncbi:MAG: hypothetical protein KKF68_03385 [Nanoarchaeota archaeon]|nr:hypothetical protein [Nanoarchaeota archaeon]